MAMMGGEQQRFFLITAEPSRIGFENPAAYSPKTRLVYVPAQNNFSAAALVGVKETARARQALARYEKKRTSL